MPQKNKLLLQSLVLFRSAQIPRHAPSLGATRLSRTKTVPSVIEQSDLSHALDGLSAALKFGLQCLCRGSIRRTF